jgi:RNA polymerase sigma factor (sigma-70 family)
MLRDEPFDQVYESLYPLLFRIAYRISGSRTRAEDLCHEAFIKYLQRGEPLPDLEQTKYWLIRVLRNISLNQEKRNARELRAYHRMHKMMPQTAAPSDQEFFREETRSLVQEALNRLPEAMRTVLVLREYAGLGYREIAGILGKSEGNVKVRAFRARERLAELLNGELGGSGSRRIGE